jgi:aspartyl-tRNA(Asn)/glutamyl-tRNA(Gln) amidotransferase subunit C
MEEFDKDTLIQLARLCRINCTDKELEILLKNLQSILGYMDQLREVNTENVPVCNHVSEAIESFMREDEPSASLDPETFLKNSPSRVGRMVRVPTVIKF